MQSGGRPAVDTPPLPFTPADVPRAPPIVFRTLSDRLRHCHAGSMEESPESGRGKAAAVAPRYRGVRRRKWGTWVAEVRLPSSRARLWLGSYPTPEMAALAHDAAVYSLRGPGAARNFLGHPPACRCSGEGSFGSRTPPGLLLAGEWLPEFAEFNAGGMRWSIEEDEDFWPLFCPRPFPKPLRRARLTRKPVVVGLLGELVQALGLSLAQRRDGFGTRHSGRTTRIKRWGLSSQDMLTQRASINLIFIHVDSFACRRTC
ncbi:hypothetical protein OPV22_011752 [Ensete ventricosum]|uniref:AP2/ERF domain-containing protein n=1 Tax=Ensete ventricosum TaxID=4639 RepID=A0AAV8Q693_ENSVE|nr:hypothetical protein OPV22_011752 [Ensete ventricosum]